MNTILFYKIWLTLIIGLVFSGCDSLKNSDKKQDPPGNYTEQEVLTVAYYGKTIDEDGVIPATEIVNKINENDSLKIKVEGEIISVCQKKGCWMKLDIGESEKMHVTFKDYEFFVPKDVSGKTAILEGMVKKEFTSVEDLRHYAEDAGKTKKEINEIVNPEERIVFEAEGVIIK